MHDTVFRVQNFRRLARGRVVHVVHLVTRWTAAGKYGSGGGGGGGSAGQSQFSNLVKRYNASACLRQNLYEFLWEESVGPLGTFVLVQLLYKLAFFGKGKQRSAQLTRRAGHLRSGND